MSNTVKPKKSKKLKAPLPQVKIPAFGSPYCTSQTDRLDAAMRYKIDLGKRYAAEKERNRAHNLKYKDSIRASMQRRMFNPRHVASSKVMARLGQLMRHLKFLMEGSYPPSTKRTRADGLTYEEILGCSAPTLKNHLQMLFKKDMKWGNYGKVWQIGHRVPIRLFDCADPAQLKACFHFRNLQPEYADDNQRRLNEIGNIVTGEHRWLS